MTTGVAVVFALIVGALMLFAWEPFPIDVTAVGLIVALALLEPWTQITASEAVSGFSNSATITILAMMIVSEGVRRTGIIQRLAATVANYTGSDPHKQLGATVGVVTPFSALMSNTAAVAMLLPMVSDLAHENDTMNSAGSRSCRSKCNRETSTPCGSPRCSARSRRHPGGRDRTRGDEDRGPRVARAGADAGRDRRPPGFRAYRRDGRIGQVRG